MDSFIHTGERFNCFTLAALLWEIFTDDWGRKFYMLQRMRGSEAHMVLMEFDFYWVLWKLTTHR